LEPTLAAAAAAAGGAPPCDSLALSNAALARLEPLAAVAEAAAAAFDVADDEVAVADCAARLAATMAGLRAEAAGGGFERASKEAMEGAPDDEAARCVDEPLSRVFKLCCCQPPLPTLPTSI
jgi:hypothetical protein